MAVVEVCRKSHLFLKVRMDVFWPYNPVHNTHQFIGCMIEKVGAINDESNPLLVLREIVLTYVVDPYLGVVVNGLVAPVLLAVLS